MLHRLIFALFFIILPAFGKPQVVASFSILGQMIEEVAGDTIDLTVIVGANQDAHVYEPRPKDVQAIAQADLVFINGLGFEPWMEKIITSSGYTGPVIAATEGVTPLMAGDPPSTDPHAWHDPRNGIMYVANIVSALGNLSPEHKELYAKRGKAYQKKIQDFYARTKKDFDALPATRKQVITAHDAFAYFGKAYGVAFLAPMGFTTDSEPSAKTLAALIRQIKESGADALFLENITNPKVMEQLAAETGVTLGGTLYSDALSAPDAGGATYLTLLGHNAALIKTALTPQNQ